MRRGRGAGPVVVEERVVLVTAVVVDSGGSVVGGAGESLKQAAHESTTPASATARWLRFQRGEAAMPGPGYPGRAGASRLAGRRCPWHPDRRGGKLGSDVPRSAPRRRPPPRGGSLARPLRPGGPGPPPGRGRGGRRGGAGAGRPARRARGSQGGGPRQSRVGH